MDNDEFKAACADLINRYPSVFAEYSEIPIPIGPGWLPLVADFAEFAARELERYPVHMISVGQFKEKYGSIRIYFYLRSENGEPTNRTLLDLLRSYVDNLSLRSEEVCEQCGEPGQLAQNKRGWWLTRCAQHRDHS